MTSNLDAKKGFEMCVMTTFFAAWSRHYNTVSSAMCALYKQNSAESFDLQVLLTLQVFTAAKGCKTAEYTQKTTLPPSPRFAAQC